MVLKLRFSAIDTHTEKEFSLHGYIVYQSILEATVGENLDCKKEPNNSED